MGKNYSTANYRKEYNTDYVKTYPSFRKYKKYFADKMQEYQAVSKKMNTRYNKNEKAKTPDGNFRAKDTLNTPKGVSNHVPLDTATVYTNNGKVSTPPPYGASQQRKTRSSDYSYINKNSLKHPVLSIGNNKYRNVYTDEIIDENEARKILEYTGYHPRYPKLKLLLYLVFCVIAFFIKGLGPLSFLIYGAGVRIKSVVTYEKKIAEYTLQFQLPATTSQKAVFHKRSNIYVYTGIILGIAQIVYYMMRN